MNLDDFIQPNSVASPTVSAPTIASENTNPASGIAINLKGKQQRQTASGQPAASMPHKSYAALNRLNGEFDYVQKRVRKTSIDDRRVRKGLCQPLMS